MHRRSPAGRGILFILTALLSLLVVSPGLSADLDKIPARGQATQSDHVTADHSKFDILNQEFATGPEVTEACLSCHTEAADQVMGTIHWTWKCSKDPQGHAGKGGLTLNNF